jgi:nicotinic acid mononucleotide adenylyltransferase
MAPNAPIRTGLGVYPGSFDPPTIAHVHLAEQAIEQCGLDRLDLVISVVTLGKSDDHLSPLAERLAELHRLADTNPAIGVRTTTHSLLADIATGYDVVVMGADKWAQVLDPSWYGGIEARNEALRRLPRIALAPRPPWPMPGDDPTASVPDGLEVVILDVDETHGPVSATEVRAGRHEWRALPPEH